MELFDTDLCSPPTRRDATRCICFSPGFLSNRVLGLAAEPQFSIVLLLIILKNNEWDVRYDTVQPMRTRLSVLLMFQCFYYYCYDYLTTHFLKILARPDAAMVAQGRNACPEPTLEAVFLFPRANRRFSFFSSLRNFVLKSFRGRHDLASVVGPHVIVEGANHTHPCMQRTGNTASCCD